LVIEDDLTLTGQILERIQVVRSGPRAAVEQEQWWSLAFTDSAVPHLVLANLNATSGLHPSHSERFANGRAKVRVVVDAIAVEDLTKSYGAVRALRGVSFGVADGEVVAILGPNGAGKTTVIEILEGYRHADSGSVSVLGMDPRQGERALRQRVGIVLQESGIDNYLSAREMLRMHAEYYDRPRPVDEVLELVGLTERANAKVRTLSGGQRRRLDLGLGLIGDPALLFLDEPTTGFDPSARRHAWSVIKGLCSLGKTILLTTHYMDEAQYLADRVLVVSAGQVVAEGTPESIGGRATAAARIRFRLPPGTTVDDLPAPAEVDRDGALVIETTEPTALLHELTGWALGRGSVLEGLSVERPSLEDVYLHLTGDPEEVDMPTGPSKTGQQ
jgi:ABC-2 type transport system ATP-binding protein